MAVLSPGQSNSTQSTDAAALAKQVAQLADSVRTIQVQNNSAPGYFAPVGGKFQNGTPNGSMHARPNSDGGYLISIAGKDGKLGDEVLIQNSVVSYVAPQMGTGAPTTTQFPTDGQYGWYENTNNGRWYWVLNSSGAIVTQDIGTFAGSITGTQHGDRSGDVTPIVEHAFTQISGSITASQHGNQNNPNLHATATSSADGFMPSGDKAYVNQISDPSVSGGTQPANVSSLRFAGVGVINGPQTGYSVTGPFTTSRSLTVSTATVTLQALADFVYTMAFDHTQKKFPNP